VTLDDCVALARNVGNELWRRYRIPVFFYEAAATKPERVNLENVRRGQFEGMKEELKKITSGSRTWANRDASYSGRYGGGGAEISGAYNVNLNTPDISVANKIAKAIRFSSGGLRYVKSMGVELKARNLAQVSINLTDYEQTPMHRVYQMVKREAERYGAVPVGSEIVGLVPKKAMEMAAEYFLQLETFRHRRFLRISWRRALSGASSTEKKEGKLAALARPFVDAVAERNATPGGGSVAAFAAALAAALDKWWRGFRARKNHKRST